MYTCATFYIIKVAPQHGQCHDVTMEMNSFIHYSLLVLHFYERLKDHKKNIYTVIKMFDRNGVLCHSRHISRFKAVNFLIAVLCGKCFRPMVFLWQYFDCPLGETRPTATVLE